MRGILSVFSKERGLAQYRTGVFLATAEEDVIAKVLPALSTQFPNVAFTFLVPDCRAELFSSAGKTLWMDEIKADPLRWLASLRKRRFEVCVVLSAGRPTYRKTKLAAFLLNARRMVIYTEGGDQLIVDRANWRSLLKYGLRRLQQSCGRMTLLFPIGFAYLLGRTLWLSTRAGLRKGAANAPSNEAKLAPGNREETPPADAVGARLLDKMRHDWDERARENAKHFVAAGKLEWNDDDFFHSGEASISGQILSDLDNICQGNDPKRMRILEIGCGLGRETRALAGIFGEVHSVDVSGEMIRRARQALADLPNVHLYQNNGTDLSVLGDLKFDFAYSYIVFQHIPSRRVIENYVREVHRVLRPGALFKFQVQGVTSVQSSADDTWVGVPISDQDALEMARQCGFEARYRQGAETQYFWLWFFKKGAAVPAQGSA